jgi:hypothetical protein
MDLNSVSVAIRPRNPWEGVDLGFAMARRWFLPLWGLWLSVAVPLMVLLALLFPEPAWLPAVLVWWLKPLYEPPLVFWMSRAMFGERPGRRDLLRRWWRIIRPQLFANLLWRRLSPNRSFYMPVAVLEGLTGKARLARLEVLGRRQQAGVWLTFVGVTVEAALEISALIVLVVMIPEELGWIEIGDLFSDTAPVAPLLDHTISLLAMSLIAPFYVAGGFGLYLTRRSELEGWDIELGFRRMAARYASARAGLGAVAGVMLAVLVSATLPADALAVGVPEPEQARAVITEVLAAPDFGEPRSERYWKYIGDRDDAGDESQGLQWLLDILSGSFKGFALFGEVVLWLAAGLGLAALGWWLARNRSWLGAGPGRNERTAQVPVTLFGLDVCAASLPADIVASARALLEQGDLRGALSLLYRGALARFIAQGHPKIPASATEGECLARVRKVRSRAESDYFDLLTRAWVRLAYGHLLPSREQLQSLCDNWRVADEPGD